MRQPQAPITIHAATVLHFHTDFVVPMIKIAMVKALSFTLLWDIGSARAFIQVERLDIG